MSRNPYDIVNEFEEAVSNYTGAPYAVAVDSCTNALFLCLMFEETKGEITIPSNTYISPAMSIIHSGCEVVIDKKCQWSGIYQLKPTRIYDAAKRFTRGMYINNSLMCLSFHTKKHLKLGKGGMILTDDLRAYEWLRKARYEGRPEGVDIRSVDVDMLGWNMYMTPQTAAQGLMLMQFMPDYNDDLPNNYKPLHEFSIFKECKII